ncbi:unnamed protein product [Rotaria magnacalcarata]|uniref:Uncharacterized protein n=1 Tax=Rotaria magnacalcarata TaxID=392030 RepID=A0A816VSZ3_9BILA|nr:unnamed protein product [Rotaria magnacalcarata]CAF2154032.1 unnamed protein product [Rotaria magnacalcarata]CAF3925036.1 unnamed protein product [Rotaria magnacalcarata]CAF3948448.1 unnamed protein product [Rotaria magnacalcarata]
MGCNSSTSMKNCRFFYLIFTILLGSFVVLVIERFYLISFTNILLLENDYRRRSGCTCSRSSLTPLRSPLTSENNHIQLSLCSEYATQRGPHQRIIAISIFGPKENKMFQMNRSLELLHNLIEDLNTVYPDNFILRVYHDDTVSASNIICPMECKHPNVDFCNMTDKLYIPPKIWRFTPAGDPLVDIMMSRDLDSPLTKRERAAVDVWLTSNKLFHSLRDHPMHGVPMLGGMWGFRPSLNRSISRLILDKIYNRELIKRYTGRADQSFLSSHVWPYAKASAIAHDSFLCKREFGQKSEPFPTQRPSANETNCFIGCVRPCCSHGKMPFGHCPQECRPKDHPEWVYC